MITYIIPGPASLSPDEDVHKKKEAKVMDEDYIGIIIGALAALIVILVLIVIVIIIRHRHRKHNNNTRRGLKPSVVDSRVTINLNDLRGSTNGKISNGIMYNSVAADDAESDKEMCNGGDKLSFKSPYLEPKDSIVLAGRELPEVPAIAAPPTESGTRSLPV
jgi:discoidin domain receptor family protein 2